MMRLIVSSLMVILSFANQSDALRCKRLINTRLLRYSCDRANLDSSTCTLSCKYGYVLVRPNDDETTCRCTQSGCSWSLEKENFCKSKVPRVRVPGRLKRVEMTTLTPEVTRFCGPPVVSEERLRVACTNADQENSVCKFACLPGYELTHQDGDTAECSCDKSECSWSVVTADWSCIPSSTTITPTEEITHHHSPWCRPEILRPNVFMRCAQKPPYDWGTVCYYYCTTGRLIGSETDSCKCTWHGMYHLCRFPNACNVRCL